MKGLAKRTQHFKKDVGGVSEWLNGETRCGQQFFLTIGCVEIIASICSSLSELLTTTGLNFIGGDDDDVTILCVEERGSTKLWLVEIGVFWADAGRNDDDDGDLGNVCCGFEETEDDEDEESTLLAVDFALGMDDKG